MLEVPVFLIIGVVAVDDDGGAAAAHGNVTSEISGEVAVAPEISAPVALSTVDWPEMVLVVPSPEDNHAGGAVGHTRSPVSVLTVLSPEIITPVRSGR